MNTRPVVLFAAFVCILLPSIASAQSAYLPNHVKISIIDTTTRSVVGSISNVDATAIAVAPNGNVVYVTDSSGLKVIDTHTSAVLASFLVDFASLPGGMVLPPFGIAVSPDGSRVYASVGKGSSTKTSREAYVMIVDALSNTLIETISLGCGQAGGLALSPDARSLYAGIGACRSGAFTGSVVVIDTSNNRASGPAITLPAYPSGITITPNGKKAYVSSPSGQFSVVDTLSRSVSSALFFSGSGLALAPDGARLYVGDPTASRVVVIDTSRDVIVDHIAIQNGALHRNL